MSGSFSSLIGHVDSSIEQRSSLLAALKAKLDTGPASVPAPSHVKTVRGSVEPIDVDAGESQPLLLMLAEESTESGQPASGPAPPDAAPPEGSRDAFTDVLAELDRGLDARQNLINALKAQLSKSSALPKSRGPPPPAAAMAQSQAPIQIVASRPAPVPASGSQPPTKRLRPAAAKSAALAPAPDLPFDAAPPLAIAPAFGSMPAPAPAPAPPAPVPAPVQQAPQAAELAALAARKAEMLRSLNAAEAAAPPPTVSSPSAGVPGAGPPPMPQAPPEPPPGTSPEEFEAYRQQCWKQYYEWCEVWQKQYQNQGSSGRGGCASAPTPGAGPPTAPPGMPSNSGMQASIPGAMQTNAASLLRQALIQGRNPAHVQGTAPSWGAGNQQQYGNGRRVCRNFIAQLKICLLSDSKDNRFLLQLLIHTLILLIPR
eukprot:TRINITY_DN5886_c0_g1_i1.p1 TRINITY_DN5886_c0_g1~~TRINITY_DN5886_c0_g1_i1.p1  ORF type:complete len:428 (-),score=115.71 TRINITY_DN5886_c0_g1_i1:586-1869(-)